MGLIRSAILFGIGTAALGSFEHHLHPPTSLAAGPQTLPASFRYLQAPVPEGEQIYFAPGDDIERVDVALIESARSSITVAMYAFTDRNLAAALARAAARGVQVRIYRDRVQFDEERAHASQAGLMLRSQRNIEVRVKGSRDLMHEKAMLIDRAVLRDGSGNWSVSAARYQDNQVSLTRDSAQVAAFQRDFEVMWNRRDNEIVQ